MNPRRLGLLATAGLIVAGCSSGGAVTPPPSFPFECSPPGGGRCGGPHALPDLHLDATDRGLHGTFLCGGTLSASETKSRVVVTYFASSVGAGGMACAMVPLAVHLHAPLGDRHVVDGATGDPVVLIHP